MSVKVGVSVSYPNSWIIGSDSDDFLAIQVPLRTSWFGIFSTELAGQYRHVLGSARGLKMYKMY